MAFPSSSVQSLIPPAPTATEKDTFATASTASTGPTKQAQNHAQHTWYPNTTYEKADIGSIVPGPGCIQFFGRIANFHDQPKSSKMPRSARGCIKMVVKDDTGALTVRLWYRDMKPVVKLGQLVSVWTAHASQDSTGKLATPNASLIVSIFPEGDRSCHVEFLDGMDDGTMYKKPLGDMPGEPLKGLVTLQTYIDTAHEHEGVKLLMCVKSIGARKKVSNKNKEGDVRELINVELFDDTADASLTLWSDTMRSVESWLPSKTVLLITDPQAKIVGRRAHLTLSSSSMIDVDPATPDATWLRKYAQVDKRREHVNPPCQDGVADLRNTLTQRHRILFTLADLDDWVRAAPGSEAYSKLRPCETQSQKKPSESFTGFLSVLILELNLSTLHKRNMLFCDECCGTPYFSNHTTTPCNTCISPITLRPNPNIVGQFLDETGAIGGGKLLWTTAAWEQLLGRTSEELAASGEELLRYMDVRLKYLRVTLVVSWFGKKTGGGRLAVLGVRM